MNAQRSRHTKTYSSVVALVALCIGFLTPIQGASAATKVAVPTTLTTCTVGGVTTLVAAGTFTCADGSAANVWTSSAGLVTADRPYIGTLRYCINNSTAVITTLTDGSASITCRSTETQVTWTRTWGVPNAPVVRNVSATSSTTAMVAYSDSTANNGSQIVKYVVSSNPSGSTATHIGSGSPTMKMSGLLPDTDYTFKVCATNAAGTTCSTSSPKIHTYPLAPSFTLNPTSETGVYGTAITGYTITQTGGNSTVYPTVYSISPAIPNGFSFSSVTGLLTGTPTGTQAPIVYTVTGTNVSGSGSATFTLGVVKAGQTISFPAISGKTFGDSVFGVSATATSGLTVSFASTTPSICEVAGTAVTINGAGTCSITASQAGNDNYNAAPDVVNTFDIAKADQTVNFAPLAGKTYGDTSFELTATASTGLDIVYVATGTCSVSGNVVTITGAGNCSITASQAGNANYNPANAIQAFDIAKADQQIAFDQIDNRTYGDSSFELGATSNSGLPVSYSASGSCTVDGTSVTIIGAGDCTITAYQAGNENYNPSQTSQTFNIAKMAITVKADSFSITYGDANPALTYQIATGSLVGSDAFTGALSRTGDNNAGNYVINQGDLALNDNYDLTFIGGTFTIVPKHITVTIDSFTKTYGDADPTFGYTVDGLVGTDVLSGSLSRATGEDVGIYSITGDLSNDNYVVTFVPGSLTITARAITVTAGSFTKTYGDADPSLTYEITSGSLVSGDSFTGAISRAPGEDVGSYAVGQDSLALTSNYVVTFVPGSLTINKAALTITPASGQGKVYDGTSNANLAYSSTGLVNGDSISGALSQSGIDVGSYEIGAGTIGAGGNYNLTVTPGVMFTITAATPVVGWSCLSGQNTLATTNGNDIHFCLLTTANPLLFGSDGSQRWTVRYSSSNTGIFTVSGGSSLGHPVSTGVATLTAVFTPSSANFNSVTLTLTVHITSLTRLAQNPLVITQWSGYQSL